MDVRAAWPADIPVVEAALQQAVAWTHVPGTAASLDGHFGAWPMAKTPAVARLVDLARAAAAELGICAGGRGHRRPVRRQQGGRHGHAGT